MSGSQSAGLSYDPLGRLRETNGSAVTQFLYEGDRLVAEYNGAGVMLRRYVHGPGVDEPLVWYEGAGLSDRRWFHTDHQGTVIATSASSGQQTGTYAYGPYGEPANDNWTGARFRYTGQIALPEVRLYHYKARVYDPGLGRFLQTDPIGYEDDLNLYAYVRNDPLNATDPSGEEAFLVARPAAGPYSHMFVLVVDDETGAITRYSYGPQTEDISNPGQLVALAGTELKTDRDDRAAVEMLGRGEAAAEAADISASRINAPDAAVYAAGEAVSRALGTPANPGRLRYNTLPTPGGANSNSAAYAVASIAQRMNGVRAPQRLPSSRNPLWGRYRVVAREVVLSESGSFEEDGTVIGNRVSGRTQHCQSGRGCHE